MVLRQQLIAEDIKIEKGFFAACHRDIKHYSCMQDSQGSQVLQRATVMLCLENAMKKGWLKKKKKLHSVQYILLHQHVLSSGLSSLYLLFWQTH